MRTRQNDKQGALTILRRATALPSATEAAWLALASAEQDAGNNSEALSALTRAVELNPRNVSAKLRRADLLLEAGDAAGAIEAMRHIEREAKFDARAADAPDASDLRAQLASLYSRLGNALRIKDPGQSLAYFRRAVELVPQNADHATGYAAALVQGRRFAEAVGILRRVIAAAPENYPAHANLAAALDELKSYDEALVEYRWLRERKPDLVVTDFFIARALDLLGRYKEALAAYESFVSRADPARHSLEIEKVNLRLPGLRRQAQREPSRPKSD